MISRVLRFTFCLALAGGFHDVCTAVPAMLAGRSASSANADYTLQPQDVIRVQVFQQEDLNKQTDNLSLSQDSAITLPLVGTISLKDKTVRQAEEAIRAVYDRDYIVNPQVTVAVVKYADRTVNVMGSVTNQGRVEFPQERGLSIVDAISLAGGQTRLADLRHVRLTRRGAGGEATVATVDVGALMNKAGSEPVMLQPGDVVYVPERLL